MKQTDDGPTLHGEVKTVMAGFCMIARSIGLSAAERAATVHMVAAAAYLEETVGAAKTKEILAATITAIGAVLS
ncbi:hypothetical protein MesoLj131c_62550 [Mesorhizobium sp. 131-3-5]|uniref:hypothetical protein n=1 Tax=Mesorhizobium sp. 131-3-5 TaxID=2744520 RepID=UPI0019251AE0|nr:hypothetical protein [Mesorhizobium sp. 131-3-5]BCH11997.1 hypothetical protein MesoLj131c_62550 [Mesorhizobium sp. 131-3-5]